MWVKEKKEEKKREQKPLMIPLGGEKGGKVQRKRGRLILNIAEAKWNVRVLDNTKTNLRTSNFLLF